MFCLRYDHQTEENPYVDFLAKQESDGQEAAYSLANARSCTVVLSINTVQSGQRIVTKLSIVDEVYAFDLSFHYWIKSSLSGD